MFYVYIFLIIMKLYYLLYIYYLWYIWRMFYWGFIKHNVFYSKTCRTSILPRKTSNVTYVIKYEPIQHLINNPHINCKTSFLLHADQNASGPDKNSLRGFWSATLFLCSGVQAVGEQAFHPVLLLQWLSWCLQLEISPHSSLNPPSPSTLMKAHTQHCQSVKQAPLSLWCLRDLATQGIQRLLHPSCVISLQWFLWLVKALPGLDLKKLQYWRELQLYFFFIVN